MATTSQKLRLRQGDSDTFQVTVVNEIDDTTFDLTNYDTLKLNIKNEYDDAAIVLALDGAVFGDPTNGVINFPITSVESLALDVKAYIYDVECRNTSVSPDAVKHPLVDTLEIEKVVYNTP